jgi:hypothetical protein
MEEGGREGGREGAGREDARRRLSGVLSHWWQGSLARPSPSNGNHSSPPEAREGNNQATAEVAPVTSR